MKSQLYKFLTICLVTASASSAFAAEPATSSDSTSATSVTTTSTIRSVTDLTETNRTTLRTALQAYQNLSATERTARGVSVGKTYLGNMITVRTRAVEQLEAVYSSGRCKDIDTTAKQAITAELAEVKASLVEQQTEVTAMTAVGTVKSLAQEIVETNRVFAIVAPASYGACSAQNIIRLRTRTFAAAVLLLKNSNVDTTQLDTYLDQASTEATSAYNYYLSALQNRSQNPRSTLTSGRDALSRAKDNLTSAYTEATKLTSTESTPGTN